MFCVSRNLATFDIYVQIRLIRISAEIFVQPAKFSKEIWLRGLPSPQWMCHYDNHDDHCHHHHSRGCRTHMAEVVNSVPLLKVVAWKS